MNKVEIILPPLKKEVFPRYVTASINEKMLVFATSPCEGVVLDCGNSSYRTGQYIYEEDNENFLEANWEELPTGTTITITI